MPDSALADISSEAFIFLGAGAAVLRQMAQPGVGQGVSEHSRTLDDPMGRLHGTMHYIYVLSLGTEEERRSMARHVNRAHGPVRSDAYSAFDPRLQLWVAATLYRGAEELQQIFCSPLSEQEHDDLYRSAALYGTTLQMPEALWPANRRAFEDYWQATMAQADVSDSVRHYVHALLAGASAPWYVKMLLPLQRLASRALIGPQLRALYRLPWTAADQRRWDLFLRVFPPLYRRLPGTLRRLPARLYLRAWRRQQSATQQR